LLINIIGPSLEIKLKMLRKYTYYFYSFFCFLTLFLLSGAWQATQAADYSINLDYGKVKPVAAVTLSKTIPAAIAVQKAEGISIELVSALTGPEQRTLPSKRLQLSFSKELYQFAATPLIITFSSAQKSQNIIGLAFDLSLDPKDYPGKYQGKVVIRPWINGTEGREWKHTIIINVSVQVQPWVRIEATQTAVALEDTSYSNSQLRNITPFILRVASNTNWVLFCRSEFESLQTEIEPEIIVKPKGNQAIQIFPAKSEWQNNRKQLALGKATTTAGGYWYELDVILMIPNFTKYISKKYSLPLQFAVDLWDEPVG
jgi:hypothetical protein